MMERHAELMRIYFYPFIAAASEYIEKSGVTLEDLISSVAFERARLRGKERLKEAIESGEIGIMRVTSEVQAEIELLSYPFSRILVSCIGDEYLLRRYALSEAKRAYKKIIEDSDILHEMAKEFSINANFFSPTLAGIEVEVYFIDYLRLASSLKEKKWKLTNQRIDKGRVKVRRKEFARLLQEAIYERVKEGLPSDVPKDICEAIKKYVEDVKELLEEKRKKFSEEELELDFGYDVSSSKTFTRVGVDFNCFPPCITHILNSLKESHHLSHTARFAATAFLLNIGIKEEKIMSIYKKSPDFDEERTRYQISHIAGSKGAGTKYTSPSCATMRTYGNCVGCEESEKISHPLSYYRRKLKEKRKKTTKSRTKPRT